MERIRNKIMKEDAYFHPEPAAPRSRFGAILGVEPGTTFASKKECVDAGVHQAIYGGIHHSRNGAFSVCLSGGYEDDEDEGEVFEYTGTGGQEDSFGGRHEQVRDQTFRHPMNESLVASYYNAHPVRVVRGSNLHSKWAPAKGYRYDGLYIVERFYMDKGKSGYNVCKFRLRRLPNQPPIPMREFA